MWILFSRFLIVVLSFPIVVMFLTKDCRQGKRNIQLSQMETESKMQMAQIGLWGGEHIALEVRSDGASIEYDCAHGSIDQKIIPDDAGHFTARGIHVREHGGPTRRDEIPDSHPAEYNGQIKNNTMTLSVKESDTRVNVGTFTLVFNQKPQLMKCR